MDWLLARFKDKWFWFGVGFAALSVFVVWLALDTWRGIGR